MKTPPATRLHAALSTKPDAIPVFLASETSWPGLEAELAPAARAYARAMGFAPKSGAVLALPGAGGAIEAALLGVGVDDGLMDAPFLLGKLASDLPAGDYRLVSPLDSPENALVGFLLGTYRFNRFKANPVRGVKLVAPEGADAKRASIIAEAVAFGRDLINRPANDLTTTALAEAAHALGKEFKAEVSEITGKDLLKKNFPMIHAVGQASAHPPRLIDLRWGKASHPKVTLVGKGVVFDTGGLDIKPSASMLLMKKDMGGAATALTIARMVMALGLRIQLRVLVPIVENAISGSSFRPGDIFPTRKGLSVEIGNTDAEGRLILGDALAYADEDKPDLLLDFATLTGAARVALGPDLPPFYTPDEALATMIAQSAAASADPVWRMPLWPGYDAMLDSKIADLNSAPGGGFAGSVVAALYLKRFVTHTKAYAHFDIYGWVPAAKPGRPDGGDPQTARLVLDLLSRHFQAPDTKR